jgi:hypothetical protein
MLPKNRDQVVMLDNVLARMEVLTTNLVSGTRATTIINWGEYKQLFDYLHDFFPVIYDEYFAGKSVGAAASQTPADVIEVFLKSCRAVLDSIWREGNAASGVQEL